MAFVHHKIQAKFCCHRSNQGFLQKQVGAGAPAQAGPRGDPGEGEPKRGCAGDAAAPGLGVPLAELLQRRGKRAAGFSKGCLDELSGDVSVPHARPQLCSQPRSHLVPQGTATNPAAPSRLAGPVGCGTVVQPRQASRGVHARLVSGHPPPELADARGILNPVQD